MYHIAFDEINLAPSDKSLTSQGFMYPRSQVFCRIFETSTVAPWYTISYIYNLYICNYRSFRIHFVGSVKLRGWYWLLDSAFGFRPFADGHVAVCPGTFAISRGGTFRTTNDEGLLQVFFNVFLLFVYIVHYDFRKTSKLMHTFLFIAEPRKSMTNPLGSWKAYPWYFTNAHLESARSLMKIIQETWLVFYWQAPFSEILYLHTIIIHYIHICWAVPPPSKSHHQDYYIFSRESL